MTELELITALRATRPGFQEEGMLHTFLTDSYTGGGGFNNGRIPTAPVPFWGRAAYEFSQLWLEFRSLVLTESEAKKPAVPTWSYLSPFFGESTREYRDRINASVYGNIVEPIVNVSASFLSETDAERKNLGPLLDKWVGRVTRNGAPMREFMEMVLLRCQLVGWCLILADLPRAPRGTSLLANVQAGEWPFLSVFWPQQVLDYDLDDDGKLVWLKLSTWHELPRTSLATTKRVAERITIWTPQTWERYEIVDDDADDSKLIANTPALASGPLVNSSKLHQDKCKINRRDSGPNPFGRVPAVPARWKKPVNDDPIKGHPQITTVARHALALFNRESERDHQLRGQVFGILVAPKQTEKGTDELGGDKDIGVGNYMEEPWGAQGITRYIAPPGAPMEAYAKTIETLKLDAYRTSMVDPGQSRTAETAEARKLRFRQTEALLASVAGNLDRAEEDILRLVGGFLGVSPADQENISVKRKESYALAQVLDEAIDAVTKAMKGLPLPPEAKIYLVCMALRSLLTDISDDEMVELEDKVRAYILAEDKRQQELKAAQLQQHKTPRALAPAAPPTDTTPPDAAPAAQDTTQPGESEPAPPSTTNTGASTNGQ